MSREPRPCGTSAAYVRHLRRGQQPCDACREANRLDKKGLRANGAPGAGGHGLSGYVNYGCRCEVCRGAKRRANAARYPVRFPDAQAPAVEADPGLRALAFAVLRRQGG